MCMYGQKYSNLQSNVRRKAFFIIYPHHIFVESHTGPPRGEAKGPPEREKKRHQICSPTYGPSPPLGLPSHHLFYTSH